MIIYDHLTVSLDFLSANLCHMKTIPKALEKHIAFAHERTFRRIHWPCSIHIRRGKQAVVIWCIHLTCWHIMTDHLWSLHALTRQFTLCSHEIKSQSDHQTNATLCNFANEPLEIWVHCLCCYANMFRMFRWGARQKASSFLSDAPHKECWGCASRSPHLPRHLIFQQVWENKLCFLLTENIIENKEVKNLTDLEWVWWALPVANSFCSRTPSPTSPVLSSNLFESWLPALHIQRSRKLFLQNSNWRKKVEKDWRKKVNYFPSLLSSKHNIACLNTSLEAALVSLHCLFSLHSFQSWSSSVCRWRSQTAPG